MPYDLEDRLIQRTVGDSPAAEGQKPFDIQGVAKTSRLATLFILHRSFEIRFYLSIGSTCLHKQNHDEQISVITKSDS